MKEDEFNRFNGLIQEMSRNLGIPDLQLDSENHCELGTAPQVIINLKYDEDLDNVLCYASVGYFTDLDNREQLLMTMMNANYFRVETRGFSLGIDPATNRIVLSDVRPVEYYEDADVLAAVLENATQVILDWQDILAANRSSGAVSALGDDPSFGPPSDAIFV